MLQATGAAQACPNCMAGNDRLKSVMQIIAVFMVVPFLLVAWIIRSVRRAQRELAGGTAAPPEAAASGTVASDGTSTALD